MKRGNSHICYRKKQSMNRREKRLMQTELKQVQTRLQEVEDMFIRDTMEVVTSYSNLYEHYLSEYIKI